MSTRTRIALLSASLSLLAGSAGASTHLTMSPALSRLGQVVAAATANAVTLTGDLTWTAVSGDTGQNSYIIGSDSDDLAVYSIRWWEDSDDPCKFRAYKRDLDDASDVNLPERSFCDGSPGNEKWAERRGANEYVTAIQICRNDKADSTKEKLKGIRLFGRTIDKAAATLGPENGPDEAKHTNCDVWRQKVACPSGQVASKFKVYYETYTVYGTQTDYGFAKGIALGCRRIARQ